MSNSSRDLHEQIDKLTELVIGKIREKQAQDPFAQQKTYEKWIKQNEWLLRYQALPLTMGMDPEEWAEIDEEGFKQQEAVTWSVLSAQLSNNEADYILNPDDDPEAWRVNSSNYYQWLTRQAITVPDALDSLMQFVLSVVARPAQNPSVNNQEDRANVVPQPQSSEREKVLGAALNIVAKEPNQCRDPSGLMNGRALAEMINTQSVLWFDSPKPPMTVEAMGNLLEKWLE